MTAAASTPGPRFRRLANAATALLIFVVIPPLTAAAMPHLIEQHNWLALDQALALGLAALSLNALLGYAGQISLGHAGFVGLGAFVAGNLFTRLPLPFPVGLLAGAVSSGIVALVIGIPALRLRGLYLAVVTLLFGLAMQYTVFPSSLLSSGSSGVAVPIRLWGNHYLTNNAWLAVICLVALVGVWMLDDNLVTTKAGRAFAAIRDNEAAAQSLGVDVTRYKLAAFVFSGAVAGIAGGLYGMAVGHVDSDMFSLFSWSLPLLIIVMVAGAGHRLAVVLVGVLYALMPQFLSAFGSLQNWVPVVGALFLLFTVSRHPGGIAELAGHRRRPPAAPGDGEDPFVASFPLLSRSAGPSGKPASTPNLEAPLLEIADVRVRFGGLVAVDGVSLEVPRNAIVGLIGPNGAGKSTLFNAIAGSVRTESGTVLLRGQEIQRLSADKRARLGIARSFQQVGLAAGLSVRENFLLAQHQLAAYGDAAASLMLPLVARRERELRARADEAIDALGLADHADKLLSQLSGGQQRIVEIACLLLTSPDLLMLDEPSAGMAPGVVENLALRLREMRDVHGQTILLIEHNVPLVMDVCDYVYVLDAGQLVAAGLPDDIVSDRRVVDAYLGQAVPA